MADDVQEVQATTMEATLSTVVDREVAKAETVAATWPERYQPRIPKDEADCRQAKRERAALRREIRDVVDARKALTKDIKEATRKVELRFKPAVEQGEDMDSAYKDGIAEYERGCVDRNLSALGGYYDELAPAMAEQVPFGRIDSKWGQEDGWHKASANLAKMQEQLQGHCQEIADTERRIVSLSADLPDEDTDRWRAEYFRTLDFNEAAKVAEEARQQRERLKALDAEREAREAYEREQQAQLHPYVPEQDPLPMESEPEHGAHSAPQTPQQTDDGQVPKVAAKGPQNGTTRPTEASDAGYVFMQVAFPRGQWKFAVAALKSIEGSHGRITEGKAWWN